MCFVLAAYSLGLGESSDKGTPITADNGTGTGKSTGKCITDSKIEIKRRYAVTVMVVSKTVSKILGLVTGTVKTIRIAYITRLN